MKLSKECIIAGLIILVIILLCFYSTENLDEESTATDGDSTATDGDSTATDSTESDQKCMMKDEYDKLMTRFNAFESAFGEGEFEVITLAKPTDDLTPIIMQYDDDVDRYLNVTDMTEEVGDKLVVMTKTRFDEIDPAQNKKCVIL